MYIEWWFAFKISSSIWLLNVIQSVNCHYRTLSSQFVVIHFMKRVWIFRESFKDLPIPRVDWNLRAKKPENKKTKQNHDFISQKTDNMRTIWNQFLNFWWKFNLNWFACKRLNGKNKIHFCFISFILFHISGSIRNV